MIVKAEIIIIIKIIQTDQIMKTIMGLTWKNKIVTMSLWEKVNQ